MSERYPSEPEIKAIENWDKTPRELIEFIASIWAYKSPSDWEIRRGRDSITYEKVYRVNFSTWGWSGNEEIIGALEGTWFWMFFWLNSRRGGHYELEISKDRLDAKSPIGYGKIITKEAKK